MNVHEIVAKDTKPLPYVQVGMLLVHPDDDAEWWEVETVLGPYPCTAGLRSNDLGPYPCTAGLRSNDARRITMPCQEVRDKMQLYKDFDPRNRFR